ncbi:fatty acid hydroxylase family protein [Myxococcus llanfairpwllgwyngyllgogerychwyrndrobwllllantysiliogogogochensis]|uniref:Fatty acid hydroxylase family protein n=1 Tax=Myxococcus llanfairpwllgwyngyllgogerychwyrndrobwllllantysiliogogogochensis TaxID=2590453 RepID=A0A540WNF4_9BACT|nr:sterol desaturase family protein [Myxococcus llanfairpwllgwyngyllgogerychwyrndrobwllllantysiliogogogochensis]TQF10558.1 fatty acid hydroxylase family protein [Myxococcus llanfairpwllgwyngyllgogerychwyrndrobwllllantysiliogogogochensis]
MAPGTIPERVTAFREQYRGEHVGPRYSGRAHFAFTSLGSLGVILLALSRVEAVRPWEWLTVPGVFLLGNVVEFLGHRGPMHHKRRGLGLLFQRHTEQHHRFFTHDALAYESSRDVKMVLFPPVLLLFFLGAVAAPLGVLTFLVSTRNVGWLFVASTVGYYLSYECLHFCHHLPPEHRLARLRPLGWLRRHHQAHHDPSKMGRWNFNITVPLSDWLFGTLALPPTSEGGRRADP